MISPLRNVGYLNFGQADVNMMAVSDTHGALKGVIPLYQNFSDNKEQLFPNKDSSSTMNIFAVVGDWFINPKQTGYLTDKTKSSGDHQAAFLGAFIEHSKEFVPNLKTFFTPGNHCLDGGSKFLLEKIKKLDMDTIITNAALEKEKLPVDRMYRYKILDVADDKNPDLKHKVLMVGLLPVNIDYLVKEDISDLNIIGSKNIKEADLTKEDMQQTCIAVSSVVEKFKKKYPKSAVVLLNHAGETVAKTVSEYSDKIDLVLNAHDHKDKTSYVKRKDGKNTTIVSLSQNCHKLEGVNIHFDDDGNITIKSNPYYSNFSASNVDNPFVDMFYESFKKDLKPLFSIKDPLGRKRLNVNNVRYGNNDLANFCTDAIFNCVKKNYPQTEVFVLGSTSFRHELPTDEVRPVLNIDLMDLFKGISGEMAEVMVGELSGRELCSFIYQNILDNFANPSRNAIFQYSGVIINKTGIKEEVQKGEKIDKHNPEQIYSYIKIRNKKGNFKSIDPEKYYNIALPKKLFIKSSDDNFKKKQKDFLNTNKMVNEYFLDFVKDSEGPIFLNLDNRII